MAAVMPSSSPASQKRGWLWAGRAILEILLIAGMWLLYDTGRVAIKGQDKIARANAHLVRNLEHTLGLPRETLVQHVLTAVPHLPRLANTWYFYMHFPVTVAFLVFGFVMRPRPQYLWARNLLMVMTGIALVGHFFFPLAPPRMFTQWGFVDTMATWGPDAYAGASGSVANQYAAMPSLHVGWALVVAFVLLKTGPKKLAVIGAAYASTTTFVVIGTANHWWLDGIVAALTLVVALMVFPEPGRTRLPLGRFGDLLVGNPRPRHLPVELPARKVDDDSSARRS
jgi:hypothetical protein